LPELDLIVLLVGSFTALALLAFALGGFCKDRSWSPLGGIKHAALVSSCQFPAYAAVISSVIASGSLRLRDIVLSQGPAPWNWQAFKSPISLFSFLIFVIAAVPEQGRSSADLPELTPELGFSEEPPPPHWHALSVFAIWGGLLVTGTLGATVFLGGWQVPFASASDQRSSAVYQTLGAVLVIAKSWAMIGLVLALRWISLRVRSEQVAGIFFRWLIPASIMALVASSASAALHEHPLWQALDQGMGLLLFAVIASLTGYFVHRIARSLRSSPAMTVNPWL
jgi:NADH:ubiquinone oxidoreductase subunit H